MLDIRQLHIELPMFSIQLNQANFNTGLHIFIGENGSGKTTLLHGIIGYGDHIKKRNIYYNNHQLHDTSEVISFIPQENPRFGINVDAYLSLTGRSNDTTKSIERFNLQQFLNQPIQTLSGGEFKRVLVAQVHHENKPIIIADEIEAHLDINQKYMVMDWLKEEAQTKTVIASVHDLSLAMTYADTITLIRNGQILKHSTDKTHITDQDLSHAFNTELKMIGMDHTIQVIRK